jgi:hypothetical protein
MPLEIWILMMTLFNLFLIATYLYFRTLHTNTSKNFDTVFGKLNTKIKRFEDQLFNSSISEISNKSDYELDEEFKR